ncbi:hypothetical protein ABTZ99_24680 [Actinosynnema sp. NPDC002837]
MHHPHDHARGHFSPGPRRPRDGHPGPLAARPWLNALAWVGVLTAIVGMTVIGLDVVCDSAPTAVGSAHADGFPGRDPFPGAPIPADDPLDRTAAGSRPARPGDAGFGIGLVFGGFALAAVAGLGRSPRRRHHATGSDPRPWTTRWVR